MASSLVRSARGHSGRKSRSAATMAGDRVNFGRTGNRQLWSLTSAPSPVYAGPVAKVVASEHQWLLPANLTEDTAHPRRSTRDWIVDSSMFLLAVGGWLLVWLDEPLGLGNRGPDWLPTVDVVVGFLLCWTLWWRRRWPVALAVAGALSGLLSVSGGIAIFALLFTTVVHRRPAVSAPVAALNVIVGTILNVYRPDPDLSIVGVFLANVAMVAVIFAWGMFIRARRQLILALRERALRAEREQQLLVAQARHVERARLAREMHDVLGHRISLLAMHAGAIEFRPDASPEEIARAAGVIRANAHEAMRELREVIAVLRQDEPEPNHPQPTLEDLPALVDESRQAGMQVEFDNRIEAPETAPAGLATSAYRIVQEALTNARKHAPGARVTVQLAGRAGDGLTIRVSNPPSVRPPAIEPGLTAGTGLIGLTERAALQGGRLEFGRDAAGEFRVGAWLPWPATQDLRTPSGC
jgi:signal transduction histidine kinase